MQLGMGTSLVLPKRGGGFVVDPLDIKLLLHLDNDFSDSSLYGRVIEAGGPTIDASQKVFGAGSMSTVGNNRLRWAGSSDFQLLTNPLQLSFRAYSTSGRKASNEFMWSVMNAWNSSGWGLVTRSWTSIGLFSNSGDKTSWPYTFPLNTWTAHRFNHDGLGNLRYYVDGVLLGVRTAPGLIDATTSNNAHLGGWYYTADNDNFTGNIDEFRLETGPDLQVTKTPTYVVEDAAFPNP